MLGILRCGRGFLSGLEDACLVTGDLGAIGCAEGSSAVLLGRVICSEPHKVLSLAN
jgi:hypothetical protein